MTVSAKRRGYDADPERELRFRRIEQELDARALSNNQTAASAMRRGKSSTPQVSGLSLDNQIVGGIGIKWAAVDIPDVQKYQLQYANNLNFLSPTTVVSYNTHFTLPDASPETTYYVRCRAYNSDGSPGNWSSTLNAETGQASVSNLADGSASSIVVKTKTAGFDPAILQANGGGGNPKIGRYLNTVVNFPVVAETLLIGVAQGTYNLVAADFVYIRLKVDGSTKIEYVQETDIGSSGILTVPGLSVPVLLAAGQHEFMIEIQLDGAGASTWEMTGASLAIWQVRK